MNLRPLLCSALSFLRIHPPDCEHCNTVQECWGTDMRKRLEELNKQEQGPKLGAPELPGARSAIASNAFTRVSAFRWSQETTTRAIAPKQVEKSAIPNLREINNFPARHHHSGMAHPAESDEVQL